MFLRMPPTKATMYATLVMIKSRTLTGALREKNYTQTANGTIRTGAITGI